MRYLFYKIEPYEQMLKEGLDIYFAETGYYGEYCSVSNYKDMLTALGQNDTVFYHIALKNPQSELLDLVKTQGLTVNMVALCANYKEGIQAMEDGSNYALQIPLETEKIVKCCKYLNRNRQHKGGMLH